MDTPHGGTTHCGRGSFDCANVALDWANPRWHWDVLPRSARQSESKSACPVRTPQVRIGGADQLGRELKTRVKMSGGGR